MKKLYRFHEYCGRMGDLTGIFVAEETDVQKLIDEHTTVHFGEVLGKHSDIQVRIEASNFEALTDDPSFIEKFEQFRCASGINPFSYLEE